MDSLTRSPFPPKNYAASNYLMKRLVFAKEVLR